jgi:hypothetical protein
MPEGSVSIEGADFDEEPTVEAENINNDSTSEAKPQGEVKAEGETQKQGDVQVTDKGTRLAADPLQQANQLRANAEAKVREYEQFLSNPQNLKRYLEELERETGQAQDAYQDELTPDMVQTTEDLQKYLAQETGKIRREVEEIQKLKYGIASQAVEEKVARTITSEIDEVRKKYPELRPTNPDGSPNPDFDPELERELGDMFEELDLDPQTGGYRGRVSLLRLADRLMKAARKGQDQGSKRAQTVIQDRRTGRVTSGTTAEAQPDESALSASQTIAARIKRAAAARR